MCSKLCINAHLRMQGNVGFHFNEIVFISDNLSKLPYLKNYSANHSYSEAVVRLTFQGHFNLN